MSKPQPSGRDPMDIGDSRFNPDMGHGGEVGPHGDLITRIPGGVNKTRVGPKGKILDSDIELSERKLGEI